MGFCVSRAACVLGAILVLAPSPSFAADAGFLTTRHVYVRGEQATFAFNAGEADTVQFAISGRLEASVTAEHGAATYTVDTSQLRAQDYEVTAKALKAGQRLAERRFSLTVAPPHDAERVPVWRWGGGAKDAQWWIQRGFTGGFTSCLRDPLDPADAKASTYWEATLDNAARYDFELGLYLHPLLSKALAKNEVVLCRKPDGSPCGGDGPKPYPLDPVVVDHAKAVVETWMARLAPYPALRHVMFHSEWHTPFCVNEGVVKMAQDELGLDVRAFLNEKGGLKSPGPPKDGLINDDDPFYRFLQWWWQRGHGVALLNQKLHRIVKAHRPDAITWHEPYRLAPVRNSHIGLDCIGTWTYGHPDIKRLCYTTYLQAAARPQGQLVQQDITLFVYGRFAVRIDEATANLAGDSAGKEPFFTAGPDYAREAIWLVLSQRPDILCFYSAGSLSPEKAELDPHQSSPETFDAIGETCNALVKPYGPAIRACRRAAPETAVLMSAAATWLSVGSQPQGYANERTLPFAALLMMNHVPFDVLLDDDILEGALDRYRTLVVPRGDTLLRSVHARICEFAARGGKVLAESSLRAAIPGAAILAFDFTHQARVDGHALAKGNAITAEEDRTIMEGYASQLAPHLEGVARPATASSPRILANSLESGGVDYHFFVNDDRTYGPRFAEWKLCFETCRPQTGEASVRAPEGAVLYDALRRKRIECRREGDRAAFDLHLPGAWGALVAVLPEAIGGVRVEAPAEATPGKAFVVRVAVIGASGQPLKGAIPLRIEVTDPLGRPSEWSRYTVAKEGVCECSFVPAINDPPGTWRIRAIELLGNTAGEATIACGQ